MKEITLNNTIEKLAFLKKNNFVEGVDYEMTPAGPALVRYRHQHYLVGEHERSLVTDWHLEEVKGEERLVAWWVFYTVRAYKAATVKARLEKYRKRAAYDLKKRRKALREAALHGYEL